MSTPTRKTNGSKAQVSLVCPHGDVCAAPSMHKEMMSSLDEMSLSLQMLIQRVEQVHSESLERAKAYIECNDEILKELRGLRRGEVEGA